MGDPVVLKRHDIDTGGMAKGSWHRLTTDPAARVLVCCQDCGMVAHLDHEVDDSGAVSPSISCQCGWHVTAVLEGWTDA